MKRFTLVILAATVAAAPAHADPISAIATAVQGFLLTSTGIAATATGAIATAVAYATVIGGSLALSLLGAQRRGGAVNPSDAKSTFETGESSVMEGVGRVRVGGLQAFGNTDGSTRARLICRLQGPIHSTEAYFLGGREVIVEANGAVSSPPWAKPGGSWAAWLNKVGDGSETAWPELISLFPTLWTSAHRVRGIAQTMLLFYNPGLAEEKYLSLYQGGAPTTEEIQRASLIYDLFDESCDVDDPSTWAWSDNGILIAAHILRRDPAFVSSRFDWTLIALEAVKAATHVATKTGTEPRARAWGIWAWESARSETMQQMLDSIGAEIRLTGEGKIYFEMIDDDPAAEIDFGPKDIIEFNWSAGPEAVERPNICRVRYYSPERNYEMADIDLNGIAWARVDEEVARYGPKYFDLELPFCPSASQAQRIARRKFEMARAETLSLTTNMVGLAAWGLLYGEIEDPDLGDILKVRFSPPRIDDEQGTVELPGTVWPAFAPWDPETDEADAPDVIPEFGYETDMITPDAPNAALQITYPSGGKEFRIGFSLPAQEYDTVEANYRTYTGLLPNTYLSMTEADTLAWVAGDLLGATIDARVRVFDGDDGTFFSPLLHAVVGVDNSPCAAPIEVSHTIVTDGGSKTLTAIVRAAELRAAAIELRRSVNGAPFALVTTTPVRPGQNATMTDTVTGSPASVEWRLRTLTSNGTPGANLIYG